MIEFKSERSGTGNRGGEIGSRATRSDQSNEIEQSNATAKNSDRKRMREGGNPI